MKALRKCQQTHGAELESDIPISFGNDEQALAATEQAVALYDRSHWGRIQVSDRDRLTFLHNQSTNDFKSLQPGQGCDAVILTSTARTIDLVSAYITEDAAILLTAPASRQTLLSWLDRYIFFGDKVQLSDLTDATVCFSLMGPQSAALLAQIGCTELPPVLNHHRIGNIANQIPVRFAVGSGLSIPGFTLIAQQEGEALWQILTDAGAVPLGERGWEQLRIQQGRPMPGAELTEDYNPLEAGLWHTVSFNKGCYIGQETIARLNTYNGVKQQLWGLRLTHPYEPGTPICINEQKVGVLTSTVSTPQGVFGLGYIKTKVGGAGLTVQIGTETTMVLELPFLTRALIGENES